MSVGRIPGTAAWAALACVALVVGGGVVAQAALPRPAAAAPCVSSAADTTAASALAQRCKTEVEVVSERSEWSTTVALPDGSMRLDVSTGAVRTEESGSWKAVDNAVEREGGVFTVASAVTPMAFSDGSGDEPFATIERDGHELAFDMPFDLPRPSVDGAQLTYAEVLPGVDLVVTVNEDATGFSEVLRVESPEAAANPRLADLTFPIDTSDGIAVRAQDGGFIAADDTGKPVFTSPVPAMWDSSSVELAPGATDAAVGPEAGLADPTVEPVGGEAVATVATEVTPDEVTITPDGDLLADRATVWPVYIDPGVSGSLNRRSAVRTEVGTRYDFLGDEGVGLCSRASSSTCSTTFQSRLLYQFAGLQGLGNLDPADVIAATFAVTGTHSNSCTPQPVTLYAVADFDQNTVYPGGGYWSPQQTLTIAHRAGCPAGQEPRRIEFDATAQAKAVATANTGLASFGIASDESSMAYWKRYGWDAGLSVIYNRAPSTPAGARTTAPSSECATGAARPSVRSATPTLRAALSDPDGGNVEGDFDLASVANPAALLWNPPLTAAQGSGAEHGLTVPERLLQDGTSYRWTVKGFDGGLSGPAHTCEFRVDLKPPVAPVVQAVAGMPAIYTEGSVGSGGIGVEGRFTFTDGDSNDVGWYRYSFLGQPQKTVPAGWSTVAFFPSQVGSQTLTVEAIDAAGWVSPARVYRFTVGFAGISDAWQLDEGTGTTAGNAVTAGTRALNLSGTAWANGLGKDLNLKPADLALRFDSTSDYARTSAPIVLTDRSFSVMAFVKLDDVAGTYTAVSQNGAQVSGFELGHRVDPSCPTGTGHCWAFWMPGSDSAATPVAVLSDVPARAGSWVQLTGVRNAGTGKLRLSVCEIGAPGIPATAVPKIAVDKAAPSAWLASGRFEVGRGRSSGAPARSWHGSVSQVRTYTGAVVIEQLRTSCQLPFTINPALDPAQVVTPPPAPAPLPQPPNLPPPDPGEPGTNVHQIFGDASGWHDVGTGLALSGTTRMSAVDMGGSSPQIMVNRNGRLYQVFRDSAGWDSADTGITLDPTADISAVNMGGTWPQVMTNDGGALQQIWGDSTGWHKMTTGLTVGNSPIAAVDMGGTWPQVMLVQSSAVWQVWADSTGWHKATTGVTGTFSSISSVNMGGPWPVSFLNAGGDLYSVWGDTGGWHGGSTGLSAGHGSVSAVNMGGTAPMVMTTNSGALWQAYATPTGWKSLPTGIASGNGLMSATNQGGTWPTVMVLE